MRGIALLACLLVVATAAVAGCGGSDGGTEETIAPVSDASTATGEPDSEGGSDGDGAALPKAEVEKLSAEVDAIGEESGAQVGVSIGAPGAPPIDLGSLTSGSAWSTIKVPIALQVIDEAGGVDGLTPEQRSNISAAITLSDNDAAATLFDDLVTEHGSVKAASQAVTDLLRKAGDDETVVSTTSPTPEFSTYGQTDWSLAAQTIFMGALLNGCIGDESGRDLVLTEMSQVGGADTWGLGSPGAAALWKGGWGPGADGDYLARQMGQIEIDGTEYAVAIAASVPGGAPGSAEGVNSQLARWLVDHVPDLGEPSGC